MTETEAKSDPQISKDIHKSLTAEKMLYILIGVVLAGVVLVPAVPTAFRRWPKLCCRYADINIKTGQARYVRYRGFVKLSEEVTDTPISLALKGETIDVADIEPWHRVYTSSPGVISPHYSFHGALRQARELDAGMFFGLSELGREKKREIAENILKLWQTKRSYFAVGSYLENVSKEVMRESGQDGSNKIENE